jgi:predicted glycosyltransferase
VISQRERLIKLGKSYKNNTKCVQIIAKIKPYLQAYQKTWSEQSWRNFVERHLDDVSYLVPSSPQGQTILKKLVNEKP